MITQALSYSPVDRATPPGPRTGKGGLRPIDFLRLIDARLLAVADVYDALVSDRPYRSGMDPQAALDLIRKGSGTQFDPEMVAALMRVMESGWLVRNVPKRVLIDA